MAGRVEGKVAFITGIARGQGRSHAVRLAEEGADIIGLDVCRDVETASYPGANADDLKETVRLVEGLGRRIVAVKADVRDLGAVQAAFDEGVAQLGRLDAVVANAGICSFGPAHELTEEQWTEMVDVNLNGVWRTTKVAVPYLIEQGQGGSIILISSRQGTSGQPNLAHYVAAKHGVVGLMRTLALELASQSIRANCVHPTSCNTPMIHNEATYKLFLPHLENPTFEEFESASRGIHSLPIPWIEPEDISNAVLFLASDEARYVTAQTLHVGQDK